MSSTTKGVPFPAATDPDNVPGDLQALATWVDSRPGVAAMTTTARNALVAPDLWPGRIIFNTTTGQLEQNASGSAGAGNWTPAESAVTPWADYTATATNATVNEARFKQIGKTVHFRIRFTFTSSTTAGNFTLPVTAADNENVFAINAGLAYAQVSGPTVGIFNLGATFSSGQPVSISGTYEAA